MNKQHRGPGRDPDERFRLEPVGLTRIILFVAKDSLVTKEERLIAISRMHNFLTARGAVTRLAHRFPVPDTSGINELVLYAQVPEETIDRLRNQAKRYGLSVTVRVPPTLPPEEEV